MGVAATSSRSLVVMLAGSGIGIGAPLATGSKPGRYDMVVMVRTQDARASKQQPRRLIMTAKLDARLVFAKVRCYM